MGMTKEKRNQIQKYILEHIDKEDTNLIEKTTKTFGISKTTVYNYIKSMLRMNKIEPTDKDYKYKICNVIYGFCYYTDTKLAEDVIFNNDIRNILVDLPDNVFEIWRYSFTEMMNNAIDHSESKQIDCLIKKNDLYTTITIFDKGIGIFKKIQKYFKDIKNEDITLDDAVMELFPGKFTTAESGHSGEGIFFTSRLMDEYIIYSKGKVFTHNNFDKDLILEIELDEKDYSTIVLMRLDNNSKKTLSEVFDMFSSDESFDFTQTQIPIKNIFPNDYPVSRSEAKRLGNAISRFEVATLDFADVPTIGQAFAHELFTVFTNSNPDIKLIPINTTPEIDRMISRVQK